MTWLPWVAYVVRRCMEPVCLPSGVPGEVYTWIATHVDVVVRAACW